MNTNNTPYEIVKRKGKDGYWIRKKDKSLIIHYPNNPDKTYTRKYTSLKPMTKDNANKQLYFLHNVLPKKYKNKKTKDKN